MQLLPGNEQGLQVLTSSPANISPLIFIVLRNTAGKMKGVLCDKGNLTYSSDVPSPKLTDGQVLIDVKATGDFSMAALYMCLESAVTSSVSVLVFISCFQAHIWHAALAARQATWLSQY